MTPPLPHPLSIPAPRTETSPDDVSPSVRSAIADYARTRSPQGGVSAAGPLGVIDLDAFDANAAAMRERAGGLPIRVASKSVRVPKAIERALGFEGYRGVFGYSLAEAITLVRRGFSDVLVAYPSVDVFAIRELVCDPRLLAEITLMVDSVAHLDYLESIRRDCRAAAGEDFRLCIDVDAAYRIAEQLTGDRMHIGPRRSPIRTADDALALARAIEQRGGFRLVGAMSYEGQIAGIGNRLTSPRGAIMRGLQAASAKELKHRRAAVVEALRSVADLEFVNGGGTGSLEVSAAEGTLTEVAAGSGLFSPALFDGYAHFRHRPAAFAALPVVRIPGPGWATVFQGGWVASGPSRPDRLPAIAWPEGLEYGSNEGPGEVQTPVTGPGTAQLRIGDLVYIRHAKAGELAEHLGSFAVVSGGEVVGEWKTYRGEGWVF